MTKPPPGWTVRPAKITDLNDVQPLLTPLDNGFNPMEMLAPSVSWQNTWSLVRGASVFVTAGLVPTWAGRQIAWAMISKAIPMKLVVWLVRAAGAVLQETLDNPILELRRIDTLVASDLPVNARFATRLGFHREATLKSFGPGGRDYDTYAILRSD